MFRQSSDDFEKPKRKRQPSPGSSSSSSSLSSSSASSSSSSARRKKSKEKKRKASSSPASRPSKELKVKEVSGPSKSVAHQRNTLLRVITTEGTADREKEMEVRTAEAIHVPPTPLPLGPSIFDFTEREYLFAQKREKVEKVEKKEPDATYLNNFSDLSIDQLFTYGMTYTRLNTHGRLDEPDKWCVECYCNTTESGYAQVPFLKKMNLQRKDGSNIEGQRTTMTWVVLVKHGFRATSKKAQASHLCGNPKCVSINHLRWEDETTNIHRKVCHAQKKCVGHVPKCVIIGEEQFNDQ